MSSKISIAGYDVKVTSVKYRSSVNSYIDTCTIELARSTVLKTKEITTDGTTAKIITFKKKDPVIVETGYDNIVIRRFVGFVKKLSTSNPVVIECEGYSMLLDSLKFSKSYVSTNVKTILQDLTAGTDIRLSDNIPDVAVSNVSFSNATYIQVLDWIKQSLLLVVYFDFDVLYCGLKWANDKSTEKIKIGWNTVEDKQLQRIESEEKIINVIDKDDQGNVSRTVSDKGIKADIGDIDIYADGIKADIEEIRIYPGINDLIKKEVANRLQEDQDLGQYGGTLTLFMLPAVFKSQILDITDSKYPERNGFYFVEDVDGSYSASGGRQTVKIRYYGKV
ncbi:MAG: hypothetical protein RBS07_15765 [Lentimicrobium sp.]|jgi:hypothetical protein|nr:hypothetical protein [Lentimicrobium sp.]